MPCYVTLSVDEMANVWCGPGHTQTPLSSSRANYRLRSYDGTNRKMVLANRSSGNYCQFKICILFFARRTETSSWLYMGKIAYTQWNILIEKSPNYSRLSAPHDWDGVMMNWIALPRSEFQRLVRAPSTFRSWQVYRLYIEGVVRVVSSGHAPISVRTVG